MFRNHLQTLDRDFTDSTQFRIKQIRESFLVTSTYPPAQLVQLGHTIAICPVDDYGIHIWNINPVLYQRRRYQYLDSLMDEPTHDILDFLGVHLAMDRFNHNFRHMLSKHLHHFHECIDTVVQKEYLSTTVQFEPDRSNNRRNIEFLDDGLDRSPLDWGCSQKGHVPDFQ